MSGLMQTLCSLMNTTLTWLLLHFQTQLHSIPGNLLACTYPPEFNHTLCPSLYLSLICSLLPRLSFYPLFFSFTQASTQWWWLTSIWRERLDTSSSRPTCHASWPSSCPRSHSGWIGSLSLPGRCLVSDNVMTHSVLWKTALNYKAGFPQCSENRWHHSPHLLINLKINTSIRLIRMEWGMKEELISSRWSFLN